MKKFFGGIVIAILSVMGMVSCEKEENKDPNSIPVYVRMCFTHYATESMIEYCDIIATHSDGKNENSYTIQPNEWKRIDEYSDKLVWTDSIETTLPAAISFARILSVKDSTNKYNVDFTSNYAWGFHALNANKDSIPDRFSKLEIEVYGTTLPGYDTFIKDGSTTTEYVFHINKDGYLTDANGNLRQL